MELESFLDKLDLNRYEKEAIAYLSRVTSANAGQIYKNTTIPQGRIYSVLTTLSAKGFVETMPGKPKLYAIKDVKSSIRAFLGNEQGKIAALEKEMHDIELKPKQFMTGSKSNSVSMFYGRDEHLNAVNVLRNSARKDIKQIAPLFIGNFSTRAGTLRALERGVRMRVIIRKYESSNKEHVDICIAKGGEVRALDSKDLLSMMIIDDTEFLIGMQDDKKDEERLTILSRNNAMLQTLSETFERLWKKAKRVKIKK